MLDFGNLNAKLAAPRKKVASTKHVQEGTETCEEFNDLKYIGQYLRIYKAAEKAFIDLRETKEKARGKEHPGKWFLQVAGELVGTRKKKVRKFPDQKGPAISQVTR